MNAQQEALEIARRWWAEKPVYLDTETTGFHTADQIVELSVIDGDGQVLFSRRVKPTIPIPDEAQAYHGITDADVAGCLSFADLWPEIYPLLAGRTVCAYNGAYDQRLLCQSLAAIGGPVEQAGHLNVCCVMELFAMYYGEINHHYGTYTYKKLSFAAQHLGLPAWQEHGSLADTQACRRVLEAMVLKGKG